MPSYTSWVLANAHRRPLFAWHRRLLQFLQARSRDDDGGAAPAEEAAPRWLLKTPMHLLLLDEARLAANHRSRRRPVAAAAYTRARALHCALRRALRRARRPPHIVRFRRGRR